MTTALVDGDIVAYRVAAVSEYEDDWIATSRIDKLLDEIFKQTDSDHSIVYISGGINYRYSIDPNYKANRKDKVDPRWRQLCKDYLVDEYNAVITDGIEADDALATNQTDETIICSIDKDLLQVPGRHYNFVKGEHIDVSPVEGLQSFYRNLLIGDAVDNIRGVDRVGKVKAARYIDPLLTEEEMFQVVYELYSDPERLLRNGKLMWLQRLPGDIWNNAASLFSLQE